MKQTTNTTSLCYAGYYEDDCLLPVCCLSSERGEKWIREGKDEKGRPFKRVVMTEEVTAIWDKEE